MKIWHKVILFKAVDWFPITDRIGTAAFILKFSK